MSVTVQRTVPLGDSLTAWVFDPGVVLALAVTVLVYVWGVRRHWRDGGIGAVVSRRQVVAFTAGVLAVAVALLSPIERLAEALFGAHMVQHLLLTLVAAPLLLLGRVHLAAIPLLPVGARRRWARRLAQGGRHLGPTLVAAVVAIHIVVVLAWHIPGIYELAVSVEAVHVLEHTTLLASALGFWTVMGAARPRPVATAGLAAFVTSLVFIGLAALLTTAARPWYDAHLATTAAYGMTPLEDQQLAAAIMWVPGGIVYLGAAAAAIVRWIRADEQSVALRSQPTS